MIPATPALTIDGDAPVSTTYVATTGTSSAVRASSGGMVVYATSETTYAVRGSSINGTGGYFSSEGGHGIWATTTSNKITEVSTAYCMKRLLKKPMRCNG